MSDKPKVVAWGSFYKGTMQDFGYNEKATMEMTMLDFHGRKLDVYPLIRLSDHEASRAADKARIKDMERLLRKIHSDLLMRAEIETDGAKVINLSNGLWCRVAALAQQGKGGVK